jgi:malate/lactate dehydrogenase
MAKKVTVVGAGFYGSTTALRLAEYNIFDTVVLTDILEGKPEGLALDMNQSRSIEALRPKLSVQLQQQMAADTKQQQIQMLLSLLQAFHASQV